MSRLLRLVLAERFDVAEVRLAQAEQADGSHHHVAVLDFGPEKTRMDFTATSDNIL